MVCEVLQRIVALMGKEDMVKYTGQAYSRRNVLLGEMIISLYALQVLQYCFISCI